MCLSQYCLVYFVDKNKLYCIDACSDEVNNVLKPLIFRQWSTEQQALFSDTLLHINSVTHIHTW